MVSGKVMACSSDTVERGRQQSAHQEEGQGNVHSIPKNGKSIEYVLHESESYSGERSENCPVFDLKVELLFLLEKEEAKRFGRFLNQRRDRRRDDYGEKGLAKDQ